MEKSNKILQKAGICLFFLLISFIIGSVFRSNLLFPICPLRDSSVFQYVAKVMKNGGVPYRDVFDHKGPLVYLYNYIGELIHPNGIWLLELASMFATLLISYSIFRRYCDTLLSILGTVIVFLQIYKYLSGGNRVEEWSLPYITCGLLIFVKYYQTGTASKSMLMICGSCLAAVILLRPNMISLWIVFPFFALIHEIKEGGQRIPRFLLWFLIGFILPILPFILYFGINDALKDLWAQYIVFNFAYTNETEVSRINSIMFYLSMPEIIVGLLLLSVHILKKRKDTKLATAALSFLLVSLILTGIGGRQAYYYGSVLIPCLILPTAMELHYLTIKDNNRTALLLATALLVVALSIPWFEYTQTISMLTPANQSLEYQLSQIIQQGTKPDDKIISCVNADMFYLYSDRMAASKYSYQMPIAEVDPDIYTGFLNDLNQNPPEVIIASTDSHGGKFNLEKLSKIVNSYVATNNYYNWGTVGYYTLYGKHPYYGGN